MMRWLLFIPLFIAAQIGNAPNTYHGVLVQPPTVCGAKFGTKPLRVVTLGNSLTWSPPQPNYDWQQSNGMAATTLESDYAHTVCEALAERNHQTVALLVVQAWAIEKAIDTAQAWDRTYVEIISTFNPDVLVVQFSDNIIGADSPARFRNEYDSVIGALSWRKALVCVGGWYDFAQKFNADIESVCAAHGGQYVGIGDIFTTPGNRAESFNNLVNGGVGRHPNDLGMYEIARRIVVALEQ